jgi:ATP-dependent Zn protease
MAGRTGADVAGVVREAKRIARTARRDLTKSDLRGAIMPADPRPKSELRHVAIHEAGHAVVAHMLGHKVESVTIRGEGDAGGWTAIRLPSVSDRGLIEARVKILLAGRAANTLFGAPADTGATADLAEATRLAGSGSQSLTACPAPAKTSPQAPPITRSSWAGWCGRALMWEKPICFGSLPIVRS